MPRHKHADVIHAWADGADIQHLRLDGVWDDIPPLNESNEYRIKPRTVKHEGLVNIYRAPGVEFPSTVCCVHPSEEAAKAFAGSGTVASRIKVEWEETE